MLYSLGAHPHAPPDLETVIALAVIPNPEVRGVQARNGLGGKLGRKPSSEDLEAPLTDSGAGSPSSSGRLERRAATALAGGGAYLSEVQLNQARPQPHARVTGSK